MRMLGKTRESSTGLIISLVIDGWWVRVGGGTEDGVIVVDIIGNNGGPGYCNISLGSG